MDDTALYEWATQQYGKSWCKVTPIKRLEKEFSYQLYVSKANGVEHYASDKDKSNDFRRVYNSVELSDWCVFSLDSAVKEKAIEQLRDALARAIDDLDEQEEDSDE